MIKHIVLWRLLETAHGQDKATNAAHIKQRLEGLAGQIPGLLRIEVGINCLPSAESADLVLISEFESLEALEAYQAHPLHKAILPLIAGARSERRVVDFELDVR